MQWDDQNWPWDQQVTEEWDCKVWYTRRKNSKQADKQTKDKQLTRNIKKNEIKKWKNEMKNERILRMKGCTMTKNETKEAKAELGLSY